jgi:hypothetical protein
MYDAILQIAPQTRGIEIEFAVGLWFLTIGVGLVGGYLLGRWYAG